VHAVSVGEVNAAAPLIKEILLQFPAHRLLVTTMTPTGSRQVHNNFGDEVDHVYIPYDYPGAVQRFLDRMQPAITVIMETEIWPNVLLQCKARQIPVIFANVRLSRKSARGYRRVRRLFTKPLNSVLAFAVQSQADAERLRNLGAASHAVHITGSIKFEVSLPASLQEVARRIRHEWGENRSIVVAGSTHNGEEEIILDAYDRLKRKHPDLLLVLVPRHPERFDSVARLVKRSGYSVARRSDAPGAIPPEVEIYIGDSMGELRLFYAAADVALVGGSFLPIGGHNVLEACAVGVPVIFGPYMFNFTEISQITVDRGAGSQARGAKDLADVIEGYLNNAERRFHAGEAGMKMVEENRGALEHTMQLLKPYLEQATQTTPVTEPLVEPA
jgi:3-deoxy-D-manno-octulosonic-acid transferase